MTRAVTTARFRGDAPGAFLLATAVVGAAVAVLLVPFWVLDGFGVVRPADATPQGKAFASTPQFLLWLLILAAQVAVWLAGLVYVGVTLRRRARDLRRRDALPGRAVAAIVVAALALLLVTIALLFASELDLGDAPATTHLPKEWPLPDQNWKIRPLVVVALAIGFSAVAAMWLTSLAFLDLGRRARARAWAVRRFVRLRSELTTLLGIAGALVGLATLSSGALREAVLAANDEPVYREVATACVQRESERPEGEVRAELGELLDAYPECRQLSFDRGYVLAYGLFFTGILGIAFAPCFLAMRAAGTRLRERTYPLPRPRDEHFFEVVERRKSFDDLLQTNLSATATFKAAVAIATPLAASVLSTLLPA